MVYRKHTYMRLDGSSKISERRDMVADFQSRWVQIHDPWTVCVFWPVTHHLSALSYTAVISEMF